MADASRENNAGWCKRKGDALDVKAPSISSVGLPSSLGESIGGILADLTL